MAHVFHFYICHIIDKGPLYKFQSFQVPTPNTSEDEDIIPSSLQISSTKPSRKGGPKKESKSATNPTIAKKRKSMPAPIGKLAKTPLDHVNSENGDTILSTLQPSALKSKNKGGPKKGSKTSTNQQQTNKKKDVAETIEANQLAEVSNTLQEVCEERKENSEIPRETSTPKTRENKKDTKRKTAINPTLSYVDLNSSKENNEFIPPSMPISASKRPKRAGPAPKKKPAKPQQQIKSVKNNEFKVFTAAQLSKRNIKGETPLHAACIKRNEDLIVHLLDQGADSNTQDHNGWTPLHEVAPYANCLNIVKLLLEHGNFILITYASSIF